MARSAAVAALLVTACASPASQEPPSTSGAASGATTSGQPASGVESGATSASPSSAQGSMTGTGAGSATPGSGSASSGAASSASAVGSSNGSTDAAAATADAGLSPGDAATAAASPFGCTFAWGEPTPSSLASLGWLRFVTTWVGSEVGADGSLSSCGACGWLTGQVAPTALVPVFYAYFIGFYGHANGLQDQNQNPNGPNLATGGGALILDTANGACPSGMLCDKNKIVEMYASYARQTHAAWPTKPLVWLLEGDFVQYAASSQSHPLTYTQLGQLAALVTTAIKSNMPNAVVAIDHSTWNSDDVTKSFWSAMSAANYDMVWTTGVGNNGGFLSAGTDGGSYNGATATYSYLHGLTGKKILVDESAGMSQQNDTWSNQTASTLDALVASGVVAVNVSGAPPNYASNVMTLEPHLAATCP